jgi:hypothetical protein
MAAFVAQLREAGVLADLDAARAAAGDGEDWEALVPDDCGGRIRAAAARAGVTKAWRRRRYGKVPSRVTVSVSRSRGGSRGREHRERRHVARSTSSADGGSDGPGDPPRPGWRWANSHYERCRSCGTTLVWSDGRLICPQRSCPAWGVAR